jgi:hypothetical protein
MSLPTAASSFLNPVFGIIPPLDPTTCQVEIEILAKHMGPLLGQLVINLKHYSMDYYVKK